MAVNYAKCFLADFRCGRTTRVFVGLNGTYKVTHPDMEITRNKIVVTEFYFRGECFLSDITFEPARCYATSHVRYGRGHPSNSSTVAEIKYARLLNYVQSRVERATTHTLAKIIAKSDKNYYARFTAEFTVDDSALVRCRRDFLTCTLVARGGIQIHYDSITVIMHGCTWIVTRRGCFKKEYNGTMIAKYSDVVMAADNAIGVADNAIGVFEKIVVSILPQPIAEEITPHLRRGLRSFAWYAFD
jgi:CxxC motif-containing protein (DUF1111 family)